MAAPTYTPATESIWRMSFASLFPPRYRDYALKIGYDRFLLTLVLAFQTLTSLRLADTAFQDEALYLYYGHWQRSAWASGTEIFTHPESFFSGAPQLYPVFGSYLDSVGGLQLARSFSLLCMLSATIAVYWATRTLFKDEYGPAAPLTAALTFSLAAPVIFLGNFATYDAPSFALIAWATALAIWSATRKKSLWWSLVIGGLLALAVALKYASAIQVPITLLLTLFRHQRPRVSVACPAARAAGGPDLYRNFGGQRPYVGARRFAGTYRHDFGPPNAGPDPGINAGAGDRHLGGGRAGNYAHRRDHAAANAPSFSARTRGGHLYRDHLPGGFR